MKILGIETSCDDSAAAVVEDGFEVLSSIRSSELDLHDSFGGVVPEIASRNHLKNILPTVREALIEADIERPDAVAVTYGPGLVGALLVGIATAKALNSSWEVPLIGVNHHEGHLHSSFMENRSIKLPTVVLLVAGGHTMLILMKAFGEYSLLGQTIDDAAGEALDKCARMLGLSYPGGPEIQRVAQGASSGDIFFPRGLKDRPFDFSFSGLKTSVKRFLESNHDVDVPQVACAIQEAIVDVLVNKTIAAVEHTGAKSICIGGGVSANSLLRKTIVEKASEIGIAAHLPSFQYCVDNAAMIAGAGFKRFNIDGPSDLSLGADPRLRLDFR